jgi:hypothetical protein
MGVAVSPLIEFEADDALASAARIALQIVCVSATSQHRRL